MKYPFDKDDLGNGYVSFTHEQIKLYQWCDNLLLQITKIINRNYSEYVTQSVKTCLITGGLNCRYTPLFRHSQILWNLFYFKNLT